MRVVLVLLVAIAVAVLLMLAAGLATPATHEASASQSYRRSPAELYAIVADWDGHTSWRTGLKSIEVSPDGARVTEDGDYGTIPYTIKEAATGRRLVTEIDDADLAFGGTWTFEFAPEGEGTRLTITERGFVKNLVFRFFSRFMSQDATVKQYLADLSKKTG